MQLSRRTSNLREFYDALISVFSASVHKILGFVFKVFSFNLIMNVFNHPITPSNVLLFTTGKFQFLSGYWGNMFQPAVCVPIKFNTLEVPRIALELLEDWRILVFKDSVNSPTFNAVLSDQPVLRMLALLALDVLTLMKMPVMSGARALSVQPSGHDWVLGLPAIAKDVPAPQAALQWAILMLHASLSGQLPSIAQAQAELQTIVGRFKRLAPAGVNTLRFLQAAHQHQIPWRRVAGNVYQFGWGSSSRWLDSTFTDQTPVIAATVSRNKFFSAQALRSAGVPVPAHQLVQNAEHAIHVAKILGYPVVVKPADKDGGQGVFAGLQTPQSVQRAFADAAKLSVNVLVEKFVPGNDYRLQVYKGKVFWAAHRRPAQMTGDGIHSVAELIEATNHKRAEARLNPGSDPMVEQGSKEIVIDDEFHEWLLAQNLSLDNVPMKGQLVRLRGAANVAMGGTREGLPLNTIHPDNLALAVKAAAVLRLDLAGIDLLLPNISLSWRDTGGAICEVNGQPQLSPHLHHELLPQLVPKQGRIPIVALSIPNDFSLDRSQVTDFLSTHGINLAWVSSTLTCMQALADPGMDAVIWQLKNMPSKHNAIPVDVLDLLIELSDSETDLNISAHSEHWPSIYQRSKSILRLQAAELTQRLQSFLLQVTSHDRH